MKIRHWSIMNQSGLHHLASAVAEGERRLGHDALVVDAADPSLWRSPLHMDADIHAIHSRCAPADLAYIRDVLDREPRVVFYSHGIPEDTIGQAINQVLLVERPDVEDYWSLTRYWLARADAFVVFNYRQQALFQSMTSKGRVVDCVPFGVDTAFWSDGPKNAPHLRGAPAVWTGENQLRVKWALDALLLWPFVTERVPDAHLHAHYIPFELHRWFVDIANTNGAAYFATITPKYFPHAMLRELWAGCDFMLGTTRYGDPTCLSQQAEAAGLPVISYPGNQHASWWLQEGDQRVMADQLVGIFQGHIPPRPDKVPVPTLEDMARHTPAVYNRVVS
jgi:hypothetical protein